MKQKIDNNLITNKIFFDETNDNNYIKLEKEGFDELKEFYTKMKENNIPQFFINGRIMLTNYCKYVLEYLESRV